MNELLCIVFITDNLKISHLLLNETNIEEESVVSNDFSTTLGALILSLVFLLGVPGNLFIVWSILARIRQRSVTTLLILNLACADGLLMALTIFFIVYLANQTWLFGDIMCKGLFYLCNSNMYASIFLITLMSMHRMVVLVLPRKISSIVTSKFMKRTIICMWVLVMMISIPSAVFREVREDIDDRNKIRLDLFCIFVQVRFQYTFETVSGFIIPYAVIIMCYVLILRRLRQTKFQRKVHSEKLILAIVVTFGIFWLPYHVINMLQVCTGNFERCLLIPFSFFFWGGGKVAAECSCANPVLYTFAGKSYIKQNGVGFMARLFEGTSLDQTGNKMSRLMRKDNIGNSIHSSNCSTIPVSLKGVDL
uniref:Leukotriene B4 receptor 2b n=1 Tax=Takifugu rubripes TaxID=31033 RepID=H2SX84_TAKRU